MPAVERVNQFFDFFYVSNKMWNLGWGRTYNGIVYTLSVNVLIWANFCEFEQFNLRKIAKIIIILFMPFDRAIFYQFSRLQSKNANLIIPFTILLKQFEHSATLILTSALFSSISVKIQSLTSYFIQCTSGWGMILRYTHWYTTHCFERTCVSRKRINILNEKQLSPKLLCIICKNTEWKRLAFCVNKTIIIIIN